MLALPLMYEYINALLVFVGVFHVIEFTESKTAAVVSSVWMFGNTRCCYPKWKDDAKIINATKRHMPPQIDWEVFDVKVVMTRGIVHSIYIHFTHIH